MKVFLSPSVGHGNGTGHLKRCLRLKQELEQAGQLLIREEDIIPQLEARYGAGLFMGYDQLKQSNDLALVLDKRKTPWKDYHFFKGQGFIIALDEGGPAREYFPYLIDTIPGLNTKRPANITSYGLINLPPGGSERPRFPVRRVLVSFGGEDKKDLTYNFARAILRSPKFHRWEFTIVKGPLYQDTRLRRLVLPPHIILSECLPDLGAHLASFDLVITLYGLTCFEALVQGVPVLLLNPSCYHKQLSSCYALPQVGVVKLKKRLLYSYLRGSEKKLARLRRSLDLAAELFKDNNADLAAIINKTLTASKTSRFCPCCSQPPRQPKAVKRFASGTYMFCPECRLIFLAGFFGAEQTYNEDYFFTAYQTQYGKTYQEDFAFIKALGKTRLDIIVALLRRDNRQRQGAGLLDVGCAYGPFLAAAQEQGFRVRGLDLAASAVQYVREKLGMDCWQQDFNDFPEDSTDVVTMWYVLEHFKEAGKILAKVNRLLPAGGVFAFATPNYRGISGGKDLGDFLEKSPKDHFTVWSPDAARRVLKKYGFRLRKIRITGHHPERFYTSGDGSAVPRIFNLLLGLISRALNLGDTFEGYAVKIKEPNPVTKVKGQR